MGLIESNDFTPNSDFNQLRELVSQGHLDIKLILANPRTGSTLLETSLIQNQAINAHVHEPFHRSNNTGDVKVGYETILEEVESETKRPTSVIIKEICRGLTIGNEYERFLTLVKSPPILLIRNPLLSTASKIKMVLKGLNSWNGAPFQSNFLENFAASKGFIGWASMLEETFGSQDYRPFTDILKDERVFRTEPAATLEVMRYLQSIGRPFIIIDNTDLRADPQTVISEICRKWEIPFSGNMIRWGQARKKLYTGRSEINAWFERVQNSTQIDPPYEISPDLDDFPDFITTHLKEIELPAYYEMFNNAGRIKPSGEKL